MSRPLPLRLATTSHCIPCEPTIIDLTSRADSPRSNAPSLVYGSSSDEHDDTEDPPLTPRPRRASTKLIASNADDVRRITGQGRTQLIEKCCGGGCCMSRTTDDDLSYARVPQPDNDAYRALQLQIDLIPTTLSGVVDLPAKTVSFESVKRHGAAPPPEAAPGVVDEQSTDFSPPTADAAMDLSVHPPSFVQPHPPYQVFSSKVVGVRELTRPGAAKRTYHFDLDVTHYPSETGIDFRVGGAIGVTPPNDAAVVDEVFELLLIPRSLRDRPVVLQTTGGRWPTVWGDDKPRELLTTRRALLTWCSDLQSYPPNKALFRLLAAHADDDAERRILLFLCAAEGQGAFCSVRTGPHITLAQLLHAFPSAKPPLDHLLSVLQPLMARFYSLSSDPQENCLVADGCHRVIEMAVTVHEADHWRGGQRTGVGSGFFERQAQRWLAAERAGQAAPDLRIPMFKGLMANPLAREFKMDGPMLLIGAGVGVAPFRGFVQRRLKTANCVNKVWVLQGIRDSLLDELYSGEWGVHEDEVKRVVQSRRGESRYVQEEVRHQADLVWWIINTIDGRIFVCGSSKGMGEGVEAALVDVAMQRGNLSRAAAEEFWRLKKESGSYIAETW